MTETNSAVANTSRLDRLAQEVDDEGLDALLVTDEINVKYLTGFTGDSTYLLAIPGAPVLLSDRRYETQLAEECPGILAAVRPPTQAMNDLLVEVIQ
ncbi:MAG: aminopeptidase P family N-terminal domain-containing protein, partial [Planctomycetota bacterium]